MKEQNLVKDNNFYTSPMIDELKTRIDEQNRAFEKTYLSHQKFIDELKQVLQSQEIAHQFSLDEIRNRPAESSLVINPLDKNETGKEIKRLQEKLIKQKNSNVIEITELYLLARWIKGTYWLIILGIRDTD